MILTKKIVIAISIIGSVFICSCKRNDQDLCFSFEEIQNYYYQELKKNNVGSFDPFYIDKGFYQEIEQQLNPMIKKSNYCSVYIRSSVDNAICDVAVLFNQKKEIYFYRWNNNGFQIKTTVQNSTVEKILKTVPEHSFTIDKTDLIITDSVTEYLIKKINHKTFYYANHAGPIDNEYKPMLDLFKSFYKKLR